MNIFSGLQRLGQSLMMPVAILPIASLLLRIGAEDMLGGIIGTTFIQSAGDAIFANLPLIFAIGVSMAWARDNNGAAALAGAVGYYIMSATSLNLASYLLDGRVTDLVAMYSESGADTSVLIKNLTSLGVTITSQPDFIASLGLENAKSFLVLPTDAKGLQVEMSVLGGIIIGLIAGSSYNKYHKFKLPEYLAFFGGKRFVPIVTGLIALFVGVLIAFLWPPVGRVIDAAGHGIINSGYYGKFIYGFLNRLLIMTGLHHILNSIVWFELGTFVTEAGDVIKGEIPRFIAGDPSAGSFTAGYYSVIMFGLPGAALAMFLNVKSDRAKLASGVLLSATFTAVLTGVTEPLEFAFMFLAPLLFILHAVLTGFALVLVDMLGGKIAFSFSAGLIDFLLYFNKASNPAAIAIVGVSLFVAYFSIFYFAIKIFDIKTIGREDEAYMQASLADNGKGEAYVNALGGADNIINVSNCITRLRLEVKDTSIVSEDRLKDLGARSLIKVSDKAVQVVVGPAVEFVSDDIKVYLRSQRHQS